MTFKGNHKDGEIEIIQEHIVFQNNYATLYNDDVVFPSGATGKYLRMNWNAPYGVMVMATDHKGRPLLVKNFRHENRSWSWEIPKGFGEAELSPLECAQKELLEETGLEGQDWKLFKTLKSGTFDTYVYQTTVFSEPTTLHQEAFEAISEVKAFDKSNIPTLLNDDLISDPMTMFFLYKALATDE